MTYGDVTWGTCDGKNPSVSWDRTVVRSVRAQSSQDLRTRGEFYSVELTRNGTTNVGCVNYQALLVAGVAVNGCGSCPERKKYFQQ